MSLIDRVKKLEQQADNSREHVPALIYFPHLQTLEEAKAEYRQKHGFALPADGLIIELVECDMSKEGGGKPLKPLPRVDE